MIHAPKPVAADCKCFVCGGTATRCKAKTEDTCIPRNVNYEHDSALCYSGGSRIATGRTMGTIKLDVDLICRVCGAEYTIKVEHPARAELSTEFAERVYNACDPATPEQREAARALEGSAARLRNEAEELARKARRLRGGAT